jgi:hypothetical protein
MLIIDHDKTSHQDFLNLEKEKNRYYLILKIA